MEQRAYQTSKLFILILNLWLCGGCMPFAVGKVGPMPPSRGEEDAATSRWEVCMAQAKVRVIDEPNINPAPDQASRARKACNAEEADALRLARGADGPGGDENWARLHMKTEDLIYEIRYERASRAGPSPGDAAWDGVSHPLSRDEFDAAVARWDDCLKKAVVFFAVGNRHDQPVALAQAARRYCNRKEVALEFDSVAPPLEPGDSDAVSAFVTRHAQEQMALLTGIAEDVRSHSSRRQ